MQFSNISFLFIFLPLVMLAYFCTPKTHRNLVLFCANLVFYAWAEPVFVFLMLAILCLDYSAGLFIDKYRERTGLTRLLFWGCIVFNVLLLIMFKYRLFYPIASVEHSTEQQLLNGVVIPIGLSVYIFRGLSYVIDLYLQKIKLQKSFINLSVYIAFFGHMVCGPIIRYGDMCTELEEREETTNKIAIGYGLFIKGLAKKVFLGDTLLKLWDSVKTLDAADMTVLTAWTGIIAFAIAIYFYFSGYADMARGLAKIFGFDIPANFNYPYISKNIAEFSRRWNISLVLWFKTYVFTPIGTNSMSFFLTMFKLLGTWVLIGMWYGGAVNFVLWGFYLGLFIIMERLFFIDLLAKLPVFLQKTYTILILLFGWVIFEMDNLEQIGSFYKSMFSGVLINETSLYYLGTYLPLLILGFFCSSNFGHNFVLKLEEERPQVVRWGRMVSEILLTGICFVYIIAT